MSQRHCQHVRGGHGCRWDFECVPDQLPSRAGGRGDGVSSINPSSFPEYSTEIDGRDFAKYRLTIMYSKGLGQTLQLASVWLRGPAWIAGCVRVAPYTRILCAVHATKGTHYALAFRVGRQPGVVRVKVSIFRVRGCPLQPPLSILLFKYCKRYTTFLCMLPGDNYCQHGL